LYPDDATARHNLALIYYQIEDLDRALEHFELGRQARSDFIGTYFSIADVHMMKGQYDKAEEVLRDYLENVSEHPLIHIHLVFNYICRGQLYIAQGELEIAVKLEPSTRQSLHTKGVYNTFTGTFVDAEQEFRNALEDKEPASQYFGHHGLANVFLIQGHFRDSIAELRSVITFSQNLGVLWSESQARSILGYRLMVSGRNQEALREFNKALDLGEQAQRQDLQRLALHYKGLAYLQMRSRSRAQRTADELKTAIEGWGHQREIRRYHHLMGMIELDRKKYPEAIEHLETAMALLLSESSSWIEGHIQNNHALYMDALALAYYRSGDLERAIELYERITTLTTGRLYFGDIYAKSYYTLGRIYQRMGDNAKAEDNYNKFLALWFNADSNIPEVSDAQRRLSGLNR
jgi:tetratricopeptide (TPR) repeat protein